MHPLLGDLLPSIFSFLPWRELLQTSTVCTTFRRQALRSFKNIRENQFQKILDVIVSSRATQEDAKMTLFTISSTSIEEANTFKEAHTGFITQINALFQAMALSPQKDEKQLCAMVEKFSEANSLLWRPTSLTHLLFTTAARFKCAHHLRFRSNKEKSAVVSSVFENFTIAIRNVKIAACALSFLSFDEAKRLCLEHDLDQARQQELFLQTAFYLRDRKKYIPAYSFAKVVTIRYQGFDNLFSLLSRDLADTGDRIAARDLAHRIGEFTLRKHALTYLQFLKATS